MTEGPRDDGLDPDDGAPEAAPDAETTWLSPGGPDAAASATADTVALGPAPTTVDPLLPPPSWAAPSAPAPGAPAPPAAVSPGWSAPAYPDPATPPPPPPSGWTSAPAPAPTPAPPAYGAPAYGAPAYSPGVSGWGAVPVAPKPGIVALRPLSVGDILDGAISYIRRDPATVLGIATVISLVLTLIQVWVLTTTSDSLSLSTGEASLDESIASTFGSTAALVVQWLAGLVLGVVATGLLTVVVGQAVLGRRVSIQEAWARGRRRLLPLLGLTLLVGVITGLVAGAGIALAVGVGVLLADSAGAGLGILVGLPLGLTALAAAAWIYIRLLLAPVALVLENTGVMRSLERSWELVRGAWWRTFGIYLLATILASVVASVLSVPFALAGTVLSFDQLASGSLPLTYTIPVALGTLLTGVVTIPFSAGVVALLYVDRRIRREALDLELARAAGV
jgi:hypothetical protein